MYSGIFNQSDRDRIRRYIQYVVFNRGSKNKNAVQMTLLRRRRRRLVWHRKGDLRLCDNALYSQQSDPNTRGETEALLQIVSLFVLNPADYTPRPLLRMGGPSSQPPYRTVMEGPHRTRALLGALVELREQLQQRGGDLLLRQGDPCRVVPALAVALAVDEVRWSDVPGTEERRQSDHLRHRFEATHTHPSRIHVTTVCSYSLYHPDDLPQGEAAWRHGAARRSNGVDASAQTVTTEAVAVQEQKKSNTGAVILDSLNSQTDDDESWHPEAATRGTELSEEEKVVRKDSPAMETKRKFLNDGPEKIDISELKQEGKQREPGSDPMLIEESSEVQQVDNDNCSTHKETLEETKRNPANDKEETLQNNNTDSDSIEKTISEWNIGKKEQESSTEETELETEQASLSTSAEHYGETKKEDTFLSQQKVYTDKEDISLKLIMNNYPVDHQEDSKKQLDDVDSTTTNPNDAPSSLREEWVDCSADRWCGVPRIMGEFRRAARTAAPIRPCVPPPPATRIQQFPLVEDLEPGDIPTLHDVTKPYHGHALLGLDPSILDSILAAAATTTTTRSRPPIGELATRRAWQHFLQHHVATAERHRAETTACPQQQQHSAQISTALALGVLSPRYVVETARQVPEHGGHWLIDHLEIRDYFLVTAWAVDTDLFALHGPPRPPKKKKKTTTTTTPLVWKPLSDESHACFRAWATGTTGLPLIDAGMRELLATGYCSNRVRQNLVSVLTKELHVDWRVGAAWFQVCLTDHCVAANWGNWQYFAGVGGDPKQRRFCTVSQAVKYDPDGTYVAQWVPELAALATRVNDREAFFRPWDYQEDWTTIVEPHTQYTWHDRQRLQATGRLLPPEDADHTLEQHQQQ